MYRFTCSWLLLSFIFISACLADSTPADSLRRLLGETTPYKEKVTLYLSIGNEFINAKTDSSIYYYQLAKEIARENHDQNLVSESLNTIGVYYYNKNDLQKSTEYYFKALNGLEEIADNYQLLAVLNNNIGWNFQKQKDYERTLKYYFVAKEYMELSEDREGETGLLNNLGVVYKNLEQYDQALAYFQKALQINRAEQNIPQELFNINNIGVIYLKTNRPAMAIDYFSEAFKINTELGEIDEVANNLHNMGVALHLLGKTDAAQDTLIHALEISERLNLTDLQHQILNGLYEISLEKKQYKQALIYFQQYNALNDSLYKNNEYATLVELEAKYKVSQNERAMQLSRTELLNQQLINAVILGALFVAVLLIAFLVWIYFIKKKNEKVLIELNEEIDEQNAEIQAINQNLEQIISKRTKTIQGQNALLKEFAFMNSHKVRRPLSSILGIINLMKEETDIEKLKELVDMVDGSAKEMDDIIFEINHNLQEEKL